eukprot:TRINITY_DN34768_c1_g1_i4.p1 TRINITY_DN34768_c1_g1~~TRINITY_DN34768_c1_g1_i4.p1  ORF type:complete len:412 (+),score=12.29 TRINITY_DN34768_c1_g1_i4:348-1583(+)
MRFRWRWELACLIYVYLSLLIPVQGRAAVCFFGRPLGLHETAASLSDNLIKPLAADVFAYVPMKFMLELSTEDHRALITLPNLVKLASDQVDVVDKLEHDIAKYGGCCGLDAAGVRAETARVPGHWLGPWGRSGNGLNMLYSQRRCLEMLQHREADVNVSYDWIVPSRFDLFWETRHASLDTFPRDAIWAPFANVDYYGLHDKHAVIPHGPDVNVVQCRLEAVGASCRQGWTYAEVYLNGWQLIVEGVAALIVHSWAALRAHIWPQQFKLTPEHFLAHRLLWMGVAAHRYPSVSWLVCGLKEAAQREPGSMVGVEVCLEQGRSYRFQEEYFAASANACCMRCTRVPFLFRSDSTVPVPPRIAAASDLEVVENKTLHRLCARHYHCAVFADRSCLRGARFVLSLRSSPDLCS